MAVVNATDPRVLRLLPMGNADCRSVAVVARRTHVASDAEQIGKAMHGRKLRIRINHQPDFRDYFPLHGHYVSFASLDVGSAKRHNARESLPCPHRALIRRPEKHNGEEI